MIVSWKSRGPLLFVSVCLFNGCSQSTLDPSGPLVDLDLVAEQDALIRGPVDPNAVGSKDDWNLGALGQIQVGVYDRHSAERSLVQFSIPGEYTAGDIESATLRLTSWTWVKKHFTADFSVQVHPLLRSWKQGASVQDRRATSADDGVTGLERFWGDQDGSEDWNRKFIGLDGVDAAVEVAATATRPGGYLGVWEFDVTELAKFWADHPDRNFGLLLVCSLSDAENYPDYPIFRSREYAGPDGEKPTLVLKTK